VSNRRFNFVAASFLALSLALTASPARAEEAPPKPSEDNFFTTTNVQLLWGGGFSDAQLGYFTKTQSMTTLTLNNYTQFKYGDSFFFVDFYQGDFIDGSRQALRRVAPAHPRQQVHRPQGPPGVRRHRQLGCRRRDQHRQQLLGLPGRPERGPVPALEHLRRDGLLLPVQPALA
jgi:hypothetical protein